MGLVDGVLPVGVAWLGCTLRGTVALCEAGARSLIQVGQIARASSSKAVATRSVGERDKVWEAALTRGNVFAGTCGW
jgi:hypothetical protein